MVMPTSKKQKFVHFSAKERKDHREQQQKEVKVKNTASESWSINDTRAAVAPGITQAAQRKYNSWKNTIRRDRVHPLVSARINRCDDYEEITSINFTGHSIRLSEGARVYFQINETSRLVLVIRYGDHHYS